MKRLVAGIGNVFCGDDGFGIAVLHRLRSRPLPASVHLMDVGTRARDLTYTLLDGWDLVVLVDATGRGKPPGTVTLLELEARNSEHPLPGAYALVPEHALFAAVAQGARATKPLSATRNAFVGAVLGRFRSTRAPAATWTRRWWRVH